VLTGDPLAYPRASLPAHVRMVGAQRSDPPAPTPDWLLEPGDPWVLVTCSTDYQRDEPLAAAAIDALRDEPFRVVVTLADAYDNRGALPQAPNARIERFVAHGPVLERAVAVICHAGMGIVHKAVGGVPIAAVPIGRDQPEVAPADRGVAHRRRAGGQAADPRAPAGHRPRGDHARAARAGGVGAPARRRRRAALRRRRRGARGRRRTAPRRRRLTPACKIAVRTAGRRATLTA
jgi:hypothetical protein